jgi:hypothetical protein
VVALSPAVQPALRVTVRAGMIPDSAQDNTEAAL